MRRGRRTVIGLDIPEGGIPVEGYANVLTDLDAAAKKAGFEGCFLLRDPAVQIEELLVHGTVQVEREGGKVKATLAGERLVEGTGDDAVAALLDLYAKAREAARDAE